MLENGHSDIFTIGVGGVAGDGVKKAGIKIADFLRGRGYEIYVSFEYPSLIRGGHNFARLSAYEVTNELTNGNEYKKKIWCDHSKLDILIASNEESVELHRSELKEGAKIITDTPLSKISENPEIIFSDIVDMSKMPFDTKTELIDGNTAFAKGLQAGGLDFYLAYPMTPATSILHYLASKQTKEGLKVIQPENEISVINMALGMAYAGKRVAVGTATGGFALMQEAFSFAGMAELPLVVAVAQRQAPATGVPTHSSQSDLRFAIHAGHGEFPRIVLSPGDPEESFNAGAEALNLAWKFRVPAIVLLDKILSEHMMTSDLEKIKRLNDLKIERFEETFPGTPDKVVKVTSYEHDKNGFTTDKTEDVRKAVEKRFEKQKNIEEEMQGKETIKIFGNKESQNVVIFFGSTKGPVLEASKSFNKLVKLVQIVWLEPFDTEKVKKELEGKRVICVEGNHNGQLASLIREKTGIEITQKILKYDSIPFDPMELAEEINKIWN